MNDLLKKVGRKRMNFRSNLLKYLGWTMLLIGIPTLFIDKPPDTELPLLSGLFMLLLARETRSDERAIYIKASSAYAALILSYSIKLVTANLYSNQMIPYQLSEINHFLILVMAITLILYYFRMHITLK